MFRKDIRKGGAFSNLFRKYSLPLSFHFTFLLLHLSSSTTLALSRLRTNAGEAFLI